MLDLGWVHDWDSSLRRWRSLDNLTDVLHDGYMEKFSCLDITLLGRSVVHKSLEDTHGLAWNHVRRLGVDSRTSGFQQCS